MMHRRMNLGLMLATLTVASSAFGAVSGAALQDCDAADFQTVLKASPTGVRLESRAYWLNRQLAQWPAMDASGRFKLYHSNRGQLVVTQGATVKGADGALALDVFKGSVPQATAKRFKFVADGVVLAIRTTDLSRLSALHKQQLVLVQEDAKGQVRHATALQSAGGLDDLYARAQGVTDLGVAVTLKHTQFKLWAPTAQHVSVCVYNTGSGPAVTRQALRWDAVTGAWSARQGLDLSGKYYRYLVDVFVPGAGIVRNRVTDPYAISLTTDSRRSYISNLDTAKLKPSGWDNMPAPHKVQAQTDMVVYELHVRDFSINDNSVSAAHRGKYLAFTEGGSNGMKHLKALSDAGLTDVHLLPVFDLATIPEGGCVTPAVPDAQAPDSEAQQSIVMVSAANDCFNWGYDPYHFNAPEGSYATDAADGAIRILEFRQMVQALHGAGLRVGMDVVYNHTAASGQNEKSVLDRIVPGYYHRLNAVGVVERSTCCDNTATENMMMGKLMVDSAVLWATHYKIDSFRFDLMAHQPRTVMQALQTRVNQAVGRSVNLIGEGWNFGEVADGARFVQASQLSLNGSAVATFSDRGRDAVRGGRAGDSGEALIKNQGYINGLVYDRNALANASTPVSELMQTADMVRVGLAGSIRDYPMTTYLDASKTLQQIDYSGQPAGYASQPDEVVNYVENHDNQTLFDINAYKLPVHTSRDDRARVQMLGAAIVAFSQGVAYFHAGMDTLRSKSMDGNSYDSGDWFNRLDWSYRDNYFGSGAPPKGDNGNNYGLIKPLLANPDIKPGTAEIALARDMFRDSLKLRSSSTLFRLRSAADIKARLKFFNTGSTQNPTLLVGHLDGVGYPGAGFRELLYFVNVDKTAQPLTVPSAQGKPFVLHPVHRAHDAADKRPALQARFESATGYFSVPARTALVYVIE
ncbi:MAG: alpha-1,6-glucosidase domain-containing protein [Comamonadaceae bacterium]